MESVADVVIIGAGTGGLSTVRQVMKWTENFLVIDTGPLGTKCARVGCMPSKTFLHAANEYHRRKNFSEEGIIGSGSFSCDIPAVLRHVRTLRDRFAGSMVEVTRQLAGDRLLEGRAFFLGPQRLQVGEQIIEAKRIVLATGARPVVPQKWLEFGEKILTSQTLFDQEDLPSRIALIGLGAIGLELGQAISRLGVEVTGFSLEKTIAGLADPEVKEAAIQAIGQEFPIHLGEPAEIRETDDGLEVKAGEAVAVADKILVAMGVRPNVDDMGLETLGFEVDDRGLLPYDPQTSRVGDLPLYIAGDVNGDRAILHEAADEGFIAGRNANTQNTTKAYCRRTPLRIVFSDPQIAVVGVPYQDLDQETVVIGEIDYTKQARAILEGRNQGKLRLYADRLSGRLLGCEMAAPDAEHLGHLLSLAIHRESTVFDLLQMPFYHPTLEEGLETALHDVAQKVQMAGRPEQLALCQSRAEDTLF